MAAVDSVAACLATPPWGRAPGDIQERSRPLRVWALLPVRWEVRLPRRLLRQALLRQAMEVAAGAEAATNKRRRNSRRQAFGPAFFILGACLLDGLAKPAAGAQADEIGDLSQQIRQVLGVDRDLMATAGQALPERFVRSDQRRRRPVILNPSVCQQVAPGIPRVEIVVAQYQFVLAGIQFDNRFRRRCRDIHEISACLEDRAER